MTTTDDRIAAIERRVADIEARLGPPLPEPPPPPPAQVYPADVLDLSHWKWTGPVGKPGDPIEVPQPALATYSHSRWFRPSPAPVTVDGGAARRGVVFGAPVNGVTTSGSKNPRSELREMTGDGTKPAGWSSTVGTHTMRVVQAFTRLPDGKPHVVGGQIHDASNDISVFRLEGTNLYMTNGNDSHAFPITTTYRLGTPFEAKFVVAGGVVRGFFNGKAVGQISRKGSGWYFKSGAYTQANCTDRNVPCSAENWGEVTVYELEVTHV